MALPLAQARNAAPAAHPAGATPKLCSGHKPTAPFMYRPDGLSRVKGVHVRRAANLG